MDVTRRRFFGLVPALLSAGRSGNRARSLDVVSRSAWGARPATGPYSPHRLDRITVHHTGRRLTSSRFAPAELRYWQIDHQTTRGWPDLAYHFMVDLAGLVYEVRPVSVRGDTATDYDPAGHLLLSLIGNYESQVPTEPQLETLVLLLAWASWRHGLDPNSVSGHRDHAATACPGREVYGLLPVIRGRVNDLVAEPVRLRYGPQPGWSGPIAFLD